MWSTTRPTLSIPSLSVSGSEIRSQEAKAFYFSITVYPLCFKMVFRMNKAEIFVMGCSCPASTEAEAEAKAISEPMSK